jgi:anaerobic selenocysteine-containing dehydrogenase
MNPDDIAAAGLTDGQTVRLITDVDDGIDRQFGGLKLTAYRIPRGTVDSYFPECNILVPMGHHDALSKTPASKSVQVRVVSH